MNNNKKRKLRKKKFLEALASEKILGNVTIALKVTGLNRVTIYSYKKLDEKFSDKWDHIVVDSGETLADEAEHGLRKGILSGNMTAIIFTLKNKRPEKWSDRKVIDTPDGKPIPVSMPKTEKWLRKLVENERSKVNKD